VGKVHCRWIPSSLTDDQKLMKVSLAQDLIDLSTMKENQYSNG
jgi:hypothetical protein